MVSDSLRHVLLQYSDIFTIYKLNPVTGLIGFQIDPPGRVGFNNSVYNTSQWSSQISFGIIKLMRLNLLLFFAQ
jgi:hypothetical protein